VIDISAELGLANSKGIRMISELIERRPWSLLALWIIIVVVSAPFAASINSVVITNVEKLVPKNIESIKAMDELKRLRLTNTTTGSDYIIVVQNVPISMESYRVLYPWYANLKEEFKSLSMTSWLDLVHATENEIYNLTEVGVKQMLEATNYTMALIKNYNLTYNYLVGLMQLINATDRIYSGTYKAGAVLAPNINGFLKVLRAVNSTCNSFLLPLAKTYFNIIRVEALLEAYTQAYERGSLTLTDIAIVIERSANLTSYGVFNPSLPFVVVVYKYVTSHGGPLNFSNVLAADLAYELVSEYTPSSALWMLKIAANVWKGIVGHDGDHRALLKIEGCTKEAQVSLWKRIVLLLGKAKVKAATETAESFAKNAKARLLLSTLAKTYATVFSCKAKDLSDPLSLGLANYLKLSGMPEDLARTLAVEVVKNRGKNFTKLQAAEIASKYVISKAPLLKEGVPKNLSSEIANVLISLDPKAQNNISKKDLLMYSIKLMSEALNVSVNNEMLQNLTNPREAVMILLRASVMRKAGEKGLQMLRLLDNKGLLGASPDKVKKEIPSVLVSLAMSSNVNVSKKYLELFAKTATDIYFNNLSARGVISSLAQEELSKAFSIIINKTKGLLIDKGLNGFIITISFNTPESEEKAISLISNISKRISNDLKDLGYNLVEVSYGGEKVISYESKIYAEKDIKRIDKVSMFLTIIILGVLLESLAATILPYIGIGLGLVTALAITYILAKLGIIEVSTYSRVIMFTTGLGLGIDYAGYVARRFREEAERLEPRKAAAEAFRRSWRPVLAGALTASIGFGAMSLAGSFKFITTLGTNIPIAVILVMVASITFIPALLAYVGESRWFWWPTRIRSSSRRSKKRNTLTLSEKFVNKAGIVLIIILTAGVLGSIPVATFKGSYDPSLELPYRAVSYHSLKVIEKDYDPGILYPIYVIASNSSSARLIKKEILSNPSLNALVSNVEISKNYKDDRVLVITLSIYPMSREGMSVAKKIREVVHSVDPHALVGGEPVVYLDIVNLVHRIFYHKVYPIALFLMFLTMWIIYGGAILAIAVIASVVLGAIWGVTATIEVYKYLLSKEVIWMLPIVVFTAILGVGMDYNSFFLARAREECERECSKTAIARAVSKSLILILGLASAMAGAYIGIAFSSTLSLSAMGIALTLGVLLTGLNASLLVTPALLSILGRRAWWPSKITGDKG
jgi:RND superfamily putative drug exporter